MAQFRSAANTVQPTTTGWIIGKGQDLLWFWGSALISLGLGALALHWPALALPLFCAWLLFGDGPHFWSTWTRTYWDPAERVKRGGALARSLLVWAPGFLALAVKLATGFAGLWTAFLFGAAIWGYHHAVRQDYGIWSLYARHARLDARERTEDSRFLYAGLWGVFGWFNLAQPLVLDEVGLRLPSWVAPALGLVLLALLGAYASRLVQRAFRGRPLLPGLFALFPCVGLYAVGFAWIGMREPIIAGATNLEQALAVLAIANGVQHGLQYLGLVAFTARNRYPEGGASLAEKLSAHPGRAWLFYVALSVPYLGVNLLRGAAPGVHPSSPVLLDLALATYWGFVLHHYYLDQIIWRPHKDAQLRADLRLQ